MFHSAFSALAILIQFDSLFYVIIGSMFGMICGLIPGLSGTTAMILLIPLTFGMDPNQAFVILVAAMGAATVGGSITAILIGVPGAGVNAATVFDGFPMAQKGYAAEAIGAAAASSAYGGILGALVLALFLPIMRQIILLFGPPEFLMLAVWGLSTIGSLTGRSLINGLIAVFIGLLLSFVGFNPVVGGIRYTFGLTYLWDGIPLAPLFIGFFAVSMVIDLAINGAPIAGSGVKIQNATKKMLVGIMAPIRHFGLFIRCSAIGTIIGIIPGVGGVVASFLAYGHTVQSSKDKSMFGRGDIRGVVGPESSNNASAGGALVPTISFGIPGSAATALLLGALMIHGISPGPEMLQTHLSLIWVIVGALILSNILASTVTCLAVSQLVKVTRIRPAYLVPIILAVSLAGSYSFQQRMFDVIIAVIIGLLGYILKSFNIPISPVVIAYILGSIMEKSFFQTLQIGRGSFMIFFHRPIALALALITVITLVWPFISGSLQRRKANLISHKNEGV